MDGNGRWARGKNLPRSEGHNQGAKTVRAIVEESRRLNIQYLTLYAFSRENWSRPKEEISFLFGLLTRFLKGELQVLIKNDIRLNILGDVSELPLATRKVIEHVCSKTKSNKSMTLNLALNYSGRFEIVRACKLILEQGLSADEIDEKKISDYLYTAGQPDPDLIIRTSGELRISNYLLYQSAYSELYFTKTLWPDFTTRDLHLALEDYATRQRRLGGIDPL
jgi:undecaprenyl diphosphate synthase